MSAETYTPLVVPVVVPPSEQDSQRKAGFVAGHGAGYAAGLRQAETEVAERIAALETEHTARREAEQAQLGTALEALARVEQQASALVAPAIQDAQDTITEATLALAHAVAGIELSDEPTRAKAALCRALTGVEAATVLAVRLHPADLAALDPGRVQATGVQVRADESLEPGDARTELADGYLDARVQAAFERATKALEGLR